MAMLVYAKMILGSARYALWTASSWPPSRGGVKRQAPIALYGDVRFEQLPLHHLLDFLPKIYPGVQIHNHPGSDDMGALDAFCSGNPAQLSWFYVSFLTDQLSEHAVIVDPMTKEVHSAEKTCKYEGSNPFYDKNVHDTLEFRSIVWARKMVWTPLTKPGRSRRRKNRNPGGHVLDFDKMHSDFVSRRCLKLDRKRKKQALKDQSRKKLRIEEWSSCCFIILQQLRVQFDLWCPAPACVALVSQNQDHLCFHCVGLSFITEPCYYHVSLASATRAGAGWIFHFVSWRLSFSQSCLRFMFFELAVHYRGTYVWRETGCA